MRGTILNRILQYSEVLALTIGSFVTRFWQLSTFNYVVFDETYFGSFATRYLSHEYYFDIHPPLGKLLLGFFAWIGGLPPGMHFEIGMLYEGAYFAALRFLPALVGSLLVLLIYFFVRELGFSRRVAFIAGFLVLFDNAFLVQSRFILLDIILVFLIILSIYLFLLGRKSDLFSRKWYIFQIVCGIVLGFAISVKWIGFAVLAMVWILRVAIDHFVVQSKKYIFLQVLFLLFLPLLVYFLVFIVHLSLLPIDCVHDCAGVLEKSICDVVFPSDMLFSKISLDHCRMFLSNIYFEGEHPYQSDWNLWIFGVKPISYYQQAQVDSSAAYIYFIGNPVIWWGVLVGMIGIGAVFINNILSRSRSKIPKIFFSKNVAILYLGYAIFFLPFSLISRPLFLYHYLTALIFSIILFAVFLEGMLSFFSARKAKILLFSFCVVVVLVFFYFAPLTYGIPLTEEGFFARMKFFQWAY